ncbi:Uu.00g030680.m01.CDS01 [Anthostomella pinea]|uniref:Uu.00g030680.m01.CDS01 n=1 Tax=Anthostomella pinea TaxID=933095 RepID=A0AAI8V9C8_9PEZI|nr:Uu.00g030680.m01.CDS01 [Anthostomella pinea]
MTASTEKKAFGTPITEMASRHEGVIQHVHLGYEQQLKQNRSLLTVLGMALAIAAVPYGFGGPLISAIYGGGQLSMFVGLLVVVCLDFCVAISLAELASRYPTSSGVYYWSYRLAGASPSRKALSYITGWFWLIGNWTITLSVNFGFASLIVATVSIYKPDWTASDWELLLIFYAICVLTFVICGAGDKFLPYVDAVAAVWNLVTIIAILIALASTAKSGRHSASYTLGHYDSSLSGWGSGFTFFIGLLPPAYALCAIGMITSMSEECAEPEVEVPRALMLVVPVGGLAALFFILPLCATLPPLEDVLNAPYGQVLPYILITVMGSQAGALVVMIMVLLVTLFCSISITTAAARCTWAFSRDQGIPLSSVWSRTTADRPLLALALLTVIQMLLGLIDLGSSSAFTAFASVGVIGLSAGYVVPIAISLLSGRKEVAKARWTVGPVLGTFANVVSVAWILFELVLFSMPQALPVTLVTMNYASVVFVGFAAVSGVWYFVSARKHFKGPPEEELE